MGHYLYVTVSGDSGAEGRDDEAERLWLARAIGSPDAWRLRATNAAGLLSAAAAATVVGLTLRDTPSNGGLKQSAMLAAISYVIAVLAYLVAGVLPSPKRDEGTVTLAEDIWDYCVDEARPIKWAVRIGTAAAALAIIATGIILVIAAEDSSAEQRTAVVSFTQPSVSAALQQICPALKQPVDAKVSFPDSGHVQISVPGGTCGPTRADLLVKRDDVVIVLRHS
jgi:hypothetical protein